MLLDTGRPNKTGQQFSLQFILMIKKYSEQNESIIKDKKINKTVVEAY